MNSPEHVIAQAVWIIRLDKSLRREVDEPNGMHILKIVVLFAKLSLREGMPIYT